MKILDVLDIIAFISLISLMVLFVSVILFGSVNQDCVQEARSSYIKLCCYNATDLNQNGYFEFEENNLMFGDFAMLHNAQTKGCTCSGYHPNREHLFCRDNHWFLIF